MLLAAPSGLPGSSLERALLAAGVPVEQADRDTVVPMVGLLDDATTLDRSATPCSRPRRSRCAVPRSVVPAAHWTLAPPPADLTPREAFTAPHETVAVDAAVGRSQRRAVAPYPPGVPMLVPGERITARGARRCRGRSASAGTRIAYAADPTFATVQVVRR